MNISYLTTWAANSALDFLFGTTYLACHLDDPTPAGLGSTEILGGDYSRRLIAFGAAANRAAVSANAQVFSGMPESLVAYLGVWNAPVGGRLLSAYQLDPPIAVAASGQLIVPAGDIAVLF